MENELKKCPLCGGKAELTTKLVEKLSGCYTEYYIQCYGCLLKTYSYYDKQAAIEKWNTRIDDEKH